LLGLRAALDEPIAGAPVEAQRDLARYVDSIIARQLEIGGDARRDVLALIQAAAEAGRPMEIDRTTMAERVREAMPSAPLLHLSPFAHSAIVFRY
jgi:hypothetical protein